MILLKRGSLSRRATGWWEARRSMGGAYEQYKQNKIERAKLVKQFQKFYPSKDWAKEKRERDEKAAAEDLAGSRLKPELIVPESEQRFQSVAIAGMPNAGKSTLMNALTSPFSPAMRKRGVTKRAYRSILTEGKSQVEFIDVPGFSAIGYGQEHSLLSYIATAEDGWLELSEADKVILVLDPNIQNTLKLKDTRGNLERLAKLCAPVLVINKMDKKEKAGDRQAAMVYAELMMQMTVFEEIFFISAKLEKGLTALKAYLLQTCHKDRPWKYPSHTLTTETLVDRIQSVVYEVLLDKVHGFIPWSTAIKIVKVTKSESRQKLWATAEVMPDNQSWASGAAHNIIGPKGIMLETIRFKAQQRLAAHLEIDATLSVKVVHEFSAFVEETVE